VVDGANISKPLFWERVLGVIGEETEEWEEDLEATTSCGMPMLSRRVLLLETEL